MGFAAHAIRLRGFSSIATLHDWTTSFRKKIKPRNWSLIISCFAHTLKPPRSDETLRRSLRSPITAYRPRSRRLRCSLQVILIFVFLFVVSGQICRCVFGFRNWNVRFFPIERERLQTVKNCVQKSLNLFPHFLNLLINKKKKNSFGFFLNKLVIFFGYP